MFARVLAAANEFRKSLHNLKPCILVCCVKGFSWYLCVRVTFYVPWTLWLKSCGGFSFELLGKTAIEKSW